MKVRILTMVMAGLTLTAGFASAAVEPGVPEPSSMLLLASALGAGAMFLRRRK